MYRFVSGYNLSYQNLKAKDDVEDPGDDIKNVRSITSIALYAFTERCL
jgi:hypothetical protein